MNKKIITKSILFELNFIFEHGKKVLYNELLNFFNNYSISHKLYGVSVHKIFKILNKKKYLKGCEIHKILLHKFLNILMQ